MSTTLSLHELQGRLCAAKTELQQALLQLPSAQRLQARAHLDGEVNGHRADACRITREKIERLQDVVAGLQQLTASAEHTEIVQRLEKLRNAEAQQSREARHLHAEAEEPPRDIPGVGSQYRDAMRQETEKRQATRSRFEFAVQQLRNIEQEIERLEARERELATQFHDQIESNIA